jgi:hypothetical protein
MVFDWSHAAPTQLIDEAHLSTLMLLFHLTASRPLHGVTDGRCVNSDPELDVFLADDGVTASS